jgi:PTH1 family peptidyl-tRNA hydrolase
MGISDQSSADIYMVVGLGNPGSKYNWTRHNIGFECLNLLLNNISGLPAHDGVGVGIQSKFEGQFVKCQIVGRDVRLVWPLTYMNQSGRCVSQFMRFYRIEPKNVLVICDDLSLPLGKIRIRKSGSSGGQKGLEDILRCAGTQDIPRLRIGIDPTPPHWDTADYVLSKFSTAETESVKTSLERAVQAVRRWLMVGIDLAMSEFNADPATKHKKIRKTESESKGSQERSSNSEQP